MAKIKTAKLVDSTGRTIPKNALIIRHTEVGVFSNCPRIWYITSHNGFNLEPRIKDKKLRFGTAWHAGMEGHFRDKASVGEGFKASYDAQIADMENELGQGIYDETIQKDLKEAYDLGIVLGDAYAEWSETKADPKDSDLEVIDVEKRLVVKIPGVNAWLAAKLDGIVRYSNAIWTLEHKSRSKSSKVDNPGNVNRDIQMGLQLIALQLAGYAKDGNVLGGAIYNLARKQAPGPRVTNPIFGRHLVNYTVEQLGHIMHSLKMVIVPAMRQAKAHPTITLRKYNPGIGENSYCDWGCPAKEVCEALNRSENAKYLLNLKFKERDKNIQELLFEEMEE